MTPGVRAFWPQGYNLNKLGRGSLDDASYQISRPCGFRQEDFFMFLPILVNVKQGHNLNTLVRGPHCDATYKISKL